MAEPKIPKLRQDMLDYALECSDRELKKVIVGWVERMYRKPAISIAEPESVKADATVRADIRTYKRANPYASQQHIADTFNVNPGRVSEALNEFRR